MKIEKNTKKANEFKLMFYSSDEDFDYNSIALAWFKNSWFISQLPNILKPKKVKTKATYWSKEDIERMEKDWYYNIYPRQFGFVQFEDYFGIYYGAEGRDSSHTSHKGFFLPWKSLKYKGITFYHESGQKIQTIEEGKNSLNAQMYMESIVPKYKFKLVDHDGEEIIATTHIEERRWEHGTGWCSWLKYFYPPTIVKVLSILFDKETGKRKGSWKGGTIGTSVEIIDNEPIELSMYRYCKEHDMTFVERLDNFRGEIK